MTYDRDMFYHKLQSTITVVCSPCCIRIHASWSDANHSDGPDALWGFLRLEDWILLIAPFYSQKDFGPPICTRLEVSPSVTSG